MKKVWNEGYVTVMAMRLMNGKDLRKGDIFVRNAKCRHVIGVISGFTKVQGKRCAVLPYAGAHIAYLPTGAKDPVNPGQDMGTCVMRLCFPRAVTR